MVDVHSFHLLFDHFQFTLIHGPNRLDTDPTFRFLCNRNNSLQHWTILPPPVTSTTGCCFSSAPPLHSLWSYFSTDLHPTQQQRPAEPKINRYVKIVLKGVIFHLLERSELHKCGMWNFLHRFVFSPTFVSYSIMYLY